MGRISQVGVIPGVVSGGLDGLALQLSLNKSRPVLGPQIIVILGDHRQIDDVVDDFHHS